MPTGVWTFADFVAEIHSPELKKIDPCMRAEEDKVAEIIQNDILKRELIDSQDAKGALV